MLYSIYNYKCVNIWFMDKYSFNKYLSIYSFRVTRSNYQSSHSLLSALERWGEKERDGTGKSDMRDLNIIIIILFSSFIIILNLKHFNKDKYLCSLSGEQRVLVVFGPWQCSIFVFHINQMWWKCIKSKDLRK